MKTRRIRTIMISACLAAMLAVPSATLAAIPAPQAADPVISEELMTRLIRRASASRVDAKIDRRICEIFALAKGTCEQPAREIVHAGQDGNRYFVMLKGGSEDLIVAFTSPSRDVIDSYLTDKSGNLRAAATAGLNLSNLHLITNEQAAEKFKAQMQFLAKLAEKLPPDPNRVLIERSGGPPIGVPTVLLVQLNKDFGARRVPGGENRGAQQANCPLSADRQSAGTDRELATLDEEMARAFAAARKDAAAGRIGQAGWLKDVRNRCTDASCLKNAYRQRIAHLGDLDELAGEWTRLGDSQFTRAYLTIAAVTATGFTFELTAHSGANQGLIEGAAVRTAAGADYTDEESKCVVRFARKADRLMITLLDDCVGMGGMGVTFDGEFAQGDIEPLTFTLADLKLLSPGVSEEQFAALVGGAYTAFTSSFQLMFDEKDLDGFGAKVVAGGVRGLFTEMEAIVMSHSDGRIYAAVLDDGEVKYFSNDPKFKTKLPATIERWRQRFADRPVIFGSPK